LIISDIFERVISSVCSNKVWICITCSEKKENKKDSSRENNSVKKRNRKVEFLPDELVEDLIGGEIIENLEADPAIARSPEKIIDFKFDQIKEKFGGLRAYYSGGNDYIRGLVTMAETMSYKTCEMCGNKGKPNKSGWITTLCQECRIPI
jgi:hypothetical protein